MPLQSRTSVGNPVTALATLVAMIATTSALGQGTDASYPSKPVLLVVPAAPGGTTDLAARMLAEPLGKALGQTVVNSREVGGRACKESAKGRSAPWPVTMMPVLLFRPATTCDRGRLGRDDRRGDACGRWDSRCRI